ncbi:MAG: DNA primase [Pseudomonadota bacterium]
MSGIKLPDGFLDELKVRLPPSRVIGRKVKLKKQGKEWVGLSPFTSEKTPSFYVNDQKRIFKCFSSGLGGDIIKFVQETERLSFMEAVEKLADEAGMALPKATPEEREAYDRRQRLFDACEAACQFFESQLRQASGAQARDYLIGRGLHETSWGRHRLGYAPDEWRALIGQLRRDGFSQGEIVEAGLAVQKDGGAEPYDRFRGRVIFPIEDPQGRVIAFGGRGMTPDAKPKYLNSSDTPLFNKSQILYRYKKAREALGYGTDGGLIVCEGYMDTIALSEAGIDQAVAPLGTALTEDQLALLWRAGPEPVLCFDGDRAGLGAAYRAIDRALPHLEPGRSLFFALLPEGLDPDDMIRERGRAAMDELLAAPEPLAALLWQRELAFDDVSTPERQAGLDQRLKEAAGRIKHPAVRAAYERDLKRRMNDHFWQMRRRGGTRRAAAALKAETKVRGLGLVVRVIDHPALLETGGERLALAEFPDRDVCALRDLIFDLFGQSFPLDRNLVKAHLQKSGLTRALQLLDDYPITSAIDADGADGREWLIALEQFCVNDGPGTDDVPGDVSDATASASAWKRRHQQVAEKRAMRARLNEAAEEADQT